MVSLILDIGPDAAQVTGSPAKETALQILHLTERVIGAEMISMHKRCEFKHFENLLWHAAYAVVAQLFALRVLSPSDNDEYRQIL